MNWLDSVEFAPYSTPRTPSFSSSSSSFDEACLWQRCSLFVAIRLVFECPLAYSSSFCMTVVVRSINRSVVEISEDMYII